MIKKELLTKCCHKVGSYLQIDNFFSFLLVCLLLATSTVNQGSFMLSLKRCMLWANTIIFFTFKVYVPLCRNSKRVPETSISALLTMPKPLTVWITINFGKFWKRQEYQTTWPASWETYMQVRKQQLELDMEQQTGSKEEKEYIKAVYCHPAYLTYMQSTSWETLGWMKHSWNQDCREKYQ